MTGQDDASGEPASGRRELIVLLLAGVAGAALVLLASRLQVVRVDVVAPRPLPATTRLLTAQNLVPAASALAVAVLASLAAVVATRGWLRQVTGLIGLGLGIAVAMSAASRFSVAQVLSAAGHANLSPATGAGGGISAGSTTAGSGAGQPAGSLAGFPAHVMFAGSAWRALMLTGAALIIVAGAVVIARARRLPVMSARYERSPSRASAAWQAPAKAEARRGGTAAMWDSLSAGADPTAGGGDGADLRRCNAAKPVRIAPRPAVKGRRLETKLG